MTTDKLSVGKAFLLITGESRSCGNETHKQKIPLMKSKRIHQRDYLFS